MKPISRIIVLLASLLMIGTLFLPLWLIELQAPQYPEGLSMQIWIDKLTGDINIINGLNHYIGMAYIKEENFPELQYMKYVVMVLIGLGVLVAIIGKRWFLYTWVALLLLAATVGIYDFWRWEYEYGHNLDPTAAIKVEGMNYQPPLLGYKDLLNFTAGSFPDTGGYCIIVAGILALAVALLEMFYFKKRRTEVKFPKSKVYPIMLLLAGGLFFSACSSGPQPIAYGKDGCEHCKMTIMDPKFGAELLNKQGKAFKFDSGECMIAYVKEGRIEEANVPQFLVTDFANPQTLIDAKTAHYLHSEAVPSPMGANISAFADAKKRDELLEQKGGKAISWEDFYGMKTKGIPAGN